MRVEVRPIDVARDAPRGFPEGDESVNTTLLDLIRAVGELTEDDREVVDTVIRLLRQGQFRLVGSFRETILDVT
jgi:hypothetical protein